jgi:hypothetical protein
MNDGENFDEPLRIVAILYTIAIVLTGVKIMQLVKVRTHSLEVRSLSYIHKDATENNKRPSPDLGDPQAE